MVENCKIFIEHKGGIVIFAQKISVVLFCVIKRIRSAYRKPVSLCLDVGGRGGEHVLRVNRERLKVDPQLANTRRVSAKKISGASMEMELLLF